MPMSLEPSSIVWSRFEGLESCEDKWRGDEAFWESFNAAFFLSNGLTYDPEQHSNVVGWLTAKDRAPFTDMTTALLSRLVRHHHLGDVDLVILAHWLPDLHLGSSVTNHAMHVIGLQNARGFAISDRGTSSPFFALDVIQKCMNNGRANKALLLIMDQKHLLYRSSIINALRPANTGLAMVLNREAGSHLSFAGYRRERIAEDRGIAAAMDRMAASIGINLGESRVIADQRILACTSAVADGIATDPAMVCAAPFCELERHGSEGGSFVLACLHEQDLMIVGFKGGSVRHAS